MVGVPGFEPGIAVPKTTALPLGYTPIMKNILVTEFYRLQIMTTYNSQLII